MSCVATLIIRPNHNTSMHLSLPSHCLYLVFLLPLWPSLQTSAAGMTLAVSTTQNWIHQCL